MNRVASADDVEARPAGGGAEHPTVPARDGSELDCSELRIPAGAGATLGDDERDTLVFVDAGGGRVGPHDLGAGSAALLLAGERADVEAVEALELVVVHVGRGGDLHAPMGEREHVTRLDDAEVGAATGSRSFQILFGPHNGCLHATLFVGFIPPGAAKLHYHLYDEIVRVVRGSGRVHVAGGTYDLGSGAAFRLTPREPHVVENLDAEADLVVLGVFTPAGSPSAAYLVE